MLEYLGKTVDVEIDRPLGSVHPKHENLHYPINYGFIPNTIAGDGEEIDAYILGEYKPLKKFRGIVIAVIKRKDDNEDKLVVAKSLDSYNIQQIKVLTEFQERFFESDIISYNVCKSTIRPTAKGIIRKNNKILVIEEKEDNYYRLLGGGIEFKETSTQALLREFKEEIGADIKEYKYLGMMENIFSFKEMDIHEICFLYDVILPDDYYNNDGFEVLGDIIPATTKWVNIEEFKSRKKELLPEKVLQYL
ncbi:MAG: NUDIX domain-containing protein [Vallitalea sp.]|jgi:8-oxo-dGTP pyrophosphatase MutT (NUDIX family)|nr:NUDIX domain-containing protein [Vallitalea sp.]